MKSEKSILTSFVAVAMVAMMILVPVSTAFGTEASSETSTEVLVSGINTLIDETLGENQEFITVGTNIDKNDINVSIDTSKIDTIVLDLSDFDYSDITNLVSDKTIKVDGKFLVENGNISQGRYLAIIADVISGAKSVTSTAQQEIYKESLSVKSGTKTITEGNIIVELKADPGFIDGVKALLNYVSAFAVYNGNDVVGGEISITIKDNFIGILGSQADFESKSIKQIATMISGYSATTLFGTSAGNYVNKICKIFNDGTDSFKYLLGHFSAVGSENIMTLSFNNNFNNSGTGDEFQKFLKGVINAMSGDWDNVTIGTLKTTGTNNYVAEGTLKTAYNDGSAKTADLPVKVTVTYNAPTPAPPVNPSEPSVKTWEDDDPSTGAVIKYTQTSNGNVTKITEVKTFHDGTVIYKSSIEDDITNVSTTAERSGSEVEVISVVPADATKSGKTDVVALSDTYITEVISQISIAKADTGITSVTPVISIAIDSSSGVTKTEVGITTQSMKKISDAKANVEVVSSTGTISFGADVAKTFDTGKDLSISIGEADKSELSEAQQKAVGDRTVITASAISGEEPISQLGGKVTLTVPYTLKSGENADNIEIWFVDNNGNIEKMAGSYDTNTMTVSFTTPHFSYFAISFGSDAPSSGGISVWVWIAIVVVAILIIAVAYYFLVLKKKV